jgi:protein O-mannosyl-transferase
MGDLFKSLPFFMLSLIMGLVTVWFQYHNAIGSTIVRDDGFISRLAIAGRAVWFYLYKALFPLNLSFVYPRWETGEPSVIGFLPLIGLLVMLGVFYYRRDTWGKPLLFGLGYFVLMLLPVLGFFNIYFMKYSLVADHWQYTSIIGIIALIVGILAFRYHGWTKRGRQASIIIAVLLIISLSFLSWKRAETFTCSERLWKDTLNENPKCWMAYNLLGGELAQKGMSTKAIWYFNKALEIKPDYPSAHANLANVIYELGKVDQAFTHFEKALQINPDAVEVHYNYGTALAEQGRLGQAIEHYLDTIRLQPDFIQAHYNLGVLYARQGKYTDAIKQFSEVLRINPGNRLAQMSLNRVYHLMKQDARATHKLSK